MKPISLVRHVRLFALACAILGVSSPAFAEDGGNGATTTRADSGSAPAKEPEDDGGCRASAANADLTSAAAFAGLGAVVVLARGRRRSARRR